MLDEIYLFNGHLTEDDITKLYNGNTLTPSKGAKFTFDTSTPYKYVISNSVAVKLRNEAGSEIKTTGGRTALQLD